MKKLLIWEFDDDFVPAEFFDQYDPCDECHECDFFVWDDDYGNGDCLCRIENGSEQPNDEYLETLGVLCKCPLYDLFFEDRLF